MGQYRFTATTDRGVTTDFVMGYDPHTREFFSQAYEEGAPIFKKSCHTIDETAWFIDEGFGVKVPSSIMAAVQTDRAHLGGRVWS